MKGRTKYHWFKAMYAEPAFTPGERSVLAYIAIVYVQFGGSFCVRQSVIAERCQVTDRTAGSAIRKAKRLGYLAVSRERERGTGRDRADELTLMILPELPEDSSGHFDRSDRKKTSELPEKYSGRDRKKTSELPEEANALTSGNDDPRGDYRDVSTRDAFRDESLSSPSGGDESYANGEEKPAWRREILKEAEQSPDDFVASLFNRMEPKEPKPPPPPPVDYEEVRRNAMAALENSEFWDREEDVC